MQHPLPNRALPLSASTPSGHQKVPFYVRLHERLTHSRYWSISLLLHAVLLAILSSLIIHRPPPPEQELFATVPQPSNTEPWSPPSDSPRQPKFDFSQPKQSNDVQASIVRTTSNPIPIVTTAQPKPGIFMPKIDLATPGTSLDGKDVPSELAGRFAKDGSGRIMASGIPGKGPKPTQQTEDSVLRGLLWLRDHQNPDGSWGDRNKGAMTGLALLCFLGHAELGSSPAFGLSVNKAIDWFVQNGTRFQSRLSMTEPAWGPGNGGVYEHAIAAYALGEYFTLTSRHGQADERLVEMYVAAIRKIIDGQGPDGGWMYHYDKTQSDTSVSGWQVQALKAAHLTNLQIPGLTESLDKSMKNFDRVHGPNGGYGYRTAEDRYSLTGVGVLCELFWRNERSKHIRDAVSFIRDRTQKEFPLEYFHAKGDLYAWYYHTQALLMFGGPAWDQWSRQFSSQLTKSQSQDGSWPVMNNPGHGNLQTDATITGAVYRTTFSILILESYYRYLPANQALESRQESSFASLR